MHTHTTQHPHSHIRLTDQHQRQKSTHTHKLFKPHIPTQYMRRTLHQKTHHLTQCFVKHARIHHIPYTSVHGPTQPTQNSSSAHKTYTHTFLTWGTEYMTLSRHPQIITPPPSNNFQETQHPHTKHNINIDRLPHTRVMPVL